MKCKLLIILLLISISGFSQTHNLKEIEKIKFKPFSQKNLPATKSLVNENGYYFLETEKKKKKGIYTLHHYNINLELVKSKEINISFNLDQRKIIHFTQMGDKILVFESLTQKEKKTKSIKMSTYDPISLEKTAESKIIFKSIYQGASKRANRYHFSKSPNSKFLLICESNYKPKNKREIGITILNEERENIYTEKIPVKSKRYFILQNILISDLGEAYIFQKWCNVVGIHPYSKTGYKLDFRDVWYHRKGKIEYYIHKITKERKTVAKLNLNKNIKELHMNFDLNQIPFFMGFNFKKNYKGVILINTDGNNFDEKNLNYNYFNYSDNKNYSSLLDKQYGRSAHRTLRLRNIFQKPNGNYIIIGEEGYQNTPEVTYSKIHYYTNYSMIISEINNQHGDVWSHLIKKRNSTNINHPKSFFLFNSNNEIFLLYNKSKESFNMTYINEDGKIKTNPFRKYSCSTFPTKNVKISDEEFLILINRKKGELELAKFQVIIN